MKKLKTFNVLMVALALLLINLASVNVHAADREYIEVEVPAVYIPIDGETNEVIEHFGVRPTFVNMFELPEVAEIVDGTPFISYHGIPKPPEGTWSESNFLYYGNVMYRNKFHRTIGAGLSQNSPGWPYTNSSILKVEYGDFVDEDYINGLHGMTRTPYQDGEVLKLYIVAREGSLSTPTFHYDSVTYYKHFSDDAIRNFLYANIDELEYTRAATPVAINHLTLQEEIKEVLDTIWIFDIEADDFLRDTYGNYLDFTTASINELEAKEYTVVFPLYYEKPIDHVYLSAPERFSRHRYTVSDSIYFNMNLEELTTNIEVHHVDEEGNPVADTDVLSGVVGSEWEAFAKEIFGYRLIEIPEVTDGFFEEEDFELFFVYEAITPSNVVVRHVDEEGNELAEPTVLSGAYGEAWEAKEETITDYELLRKPEVVEGIFTEEEVEVIFVYKKGEVLGVEPEEKPKTPPTGIYNNEFMYLGLASISTLFIIKKKKR